MDSNFHYSWGLRGENVGAGVGYEDNKNYIVRTRQIVERFFNVNQNINYIDEYTVKAILFHLEQHYEECYPLFKANEAIKNNFYKPEVLELKGGEIVWI